MNSPRVEPHWHLAQDIEGISPVEIVAHQDQGYDDIIPLVILQGDDVVWVSLEQAKLLRDFINEEVLKNEPRLCRCGT